LAVPIGVPNYISQGALVTQFLDLFAGVDHDEYSEGEDDLDDRGQGMFSAPIGMS
jgi:hypothetical protein